MGGRGHMGRVMQFCPKSLYNLTVESIMLQHMLNQYDKLSVHISSLETDVSSLKNRIESPMKNAAKKKTTKIYNKKV